MSSEELSLILTSAALEEQALHFALPAQHSRENFEDGSAEEQPEGESMGALFLPLVFWEVMWVARVSPYSNHLLQSRELTLRV